MAGPLFAVVALLCATVAPQASAQTIGMVADDATDKVIVFDADTNTVLGSFRG